MIDDIAIDANWVAIRPARRDGILFALKTRESGGLAPSGIGWYNPALNSFGIAQATTERSRRVETAREVGSLHWLKAPPGGNPLKFAPEPTGEMVGSK